MDLEVESINILSKDISELELDSSFFHYTNIVNLDTIMKNVLEPRIGKNSLYVEKTPKIFFSIGEKGIITIIDVWLRWLTSKSNISKIKYWFGTLYMRNSLCIKSIPNNMVKKNLKNPKKRQLVYAKMKNILDNSVFLILDLVENVDFAYNDIDEVKSRYYESFLKLLYPKTSNFKDLTMEYWNMHTFSNKIVEPNKITLLKSKEIYKASLILMEIIENNIEYIKDNCEFLYEYYLYNKDNIK